MHGGVDVLRPAAAAGAIPLAVHPALDFTGTSLDLARLAESWFAVTAAAPVAVGAHPDLASACAAMTGALGR